MSMFPLKMKLDTACTDQVDISAPATCGRKAEMLSLGWSCPVGFSCCGFTESCADHSSTAMCTWEGEE